MTLIPLSEIPVSARKVEEDARRLLGDRETDRTYTVVWAPGTHTRGDEYPPVVGEVLTRAAAVAYTARRTCIPGTPPYRSCRWRDIGEYRGSGQ